MIQISNSSIIIFGTYNYKDHREDSTKNKTNIVIEYIGGDNDLEIKVLYCISNYNFMITYS